MGDLDPEVARIAALEASNTLMLSEIGLLRQDVGDIKEKLDNATGGLKALIWIGGAATAMLGALHLSDLAHIITGR